MDVSYCVSWCVLKSSKNLASITTKVAIEPRRETAGNKLGTAGEAERGQERAVLLQDVLLVVAGKHNIYNRTDPQDSLFRLVKRSG